MESIKPIFTREERIKQIIKGAIEHKIVQNHMLELKDILKITDNQELQKKLYSELLDIAAKEAESDILEQVKALDRLHKYIPQYRN